MGEDSPPISSYIKQYSKEILLLSFIGSLAFTSTLELFCGESLYVKHMSMFMVFPASFLIFMAFSTVGLVLSAEADINATPLLTSLIDGEYSEFRKHLISLFKLSVPISFTIGLIIYIMSIYTLKDVLPMFVTDLGFHELIFLLASLAICEEFIFRLCLIPLIITMIGNKRINSIISCTISAIAFSLVHTMILAMFVASPSQVGIYSALLLNTFIGFVLGTIFMEKGFEASTLSHFTLYIVIKLLSIM